MCYSAPLFFELFQLFCRLTKLGWFDSTDDKNSWPFRNVLDLVGRFLQSGESSLVLIGVQLFSNLVLEMNQISEAEANRSLMKHRKIAFSFRDQHLYDIFRIGCSLLKNAASNIKSFNPNNESEVSGKRVLLKFWRLSDCHRQHSVASSHIHFAQKEMAGQNSFTFCYKLSCIVYTIDICNT